MSRMIYVYTGRLADDPKAGSAVRPVQMLKAFRDIGFEVTEVVGYSAERKRAMAEVRRAVRRGERFEFCYAETTTMPMALGDPGHLPLRPFLDLRFLAFLKRKGIPVFPYYRDCHWRFPAYGHRISIIKREIALWFYRMEFSRLERLSCKFYIPTLLMDKYLPSGNRRVDALPPGCYPNFLDVPAKADRLDVLYVGGVTPPIYNLEELVKIVGEEAGLYLTIVCRENESASIKARCNGISNISILHRSSSEIWESYGKADIASLYLEPSTYFSMAIPIKLFEAVGYGVPILARAGTASADFVAQEGIGWVASGPEEARSILRRLAERPGELEEARARVRQAAARNTWAQRARKVAGDAEEARNAAGR